MILDKFWSLESRGICPTIEDIENEEVKKLAERLKADSDRETLNNILEWQDRNLSFWWERWPYSIFLLGVLLFSAISLIVVLCIPWVDNITISQIIIYLLVLVVLVVLVLLNLKIRYKGLLTESSFYEIVCNMFRPSLSVEKILDYRLAVCRDYAKLTGALLLNIYQDTTIYYFKIPLHVAAAVNIDDEYYILDQCLPIRTKNPWLRGWEKNKATVYEVKLRRNSDGEPSEVECREKENISISEAPQKTVDLQKLREKITKTLNIKQDSEKGEPNFKLPLQNYAMYYENDEIVFHSIVRSIINKLENELCADTDKVSQIELIEEADDLLLHVYLY